MPRSFLGMQSEVLKDLITIRSRLMRRARLKVGIGSFIK